VSFLVYFTNRVCKNVGFGRKLDIRKSPQVFEDSEDSFLQNIKEGINLLF